MQRALERGLKRLEAQRLAMLDDLRRWRPEALRVQPATGGWCALDVVDHLVKVELMLMNSVRENLPGGRVIPFVDRWRTLAVLIANVLPTRIRIPRDVAGAPEETQHESLDALIKDWADGRAEWRKVLERVGPNEVRRGMFRHRVGGWMSARCTLRFAGAHTHHHRFQLARLRRLADARH